jgi:hypothetical protein
MVLINAVHHNYYYKIWYTIKLFCQIAEHLKKLQQQLF